MGREEVGDKLKFIGGMHVAMTSNTRSAQRARGIKTSKVTPCTPRGGHHAREQDAPESGRLKGVMGVQRDLRGEIAIPPGPSGPTGGAYSLGERNNFIQL